MDKIMMAIFSIIRLITCFVLGELLLFSNQFSLLVELILGAGVICYYCLRENKIEYMMTNYKLFYVFDNIYMKVFSVVVEVLYFLVLLWLLSMNLHIYVIMFFVFDIVYELIVGISFTDMITYTRKFDKEYDAFEI